MAISSITLALVSGPTSHAEDCGGFASYPPTFNNCLNSVVTIGATASSANGVNTLNFQVGPKYGFEYVSVQTRSKVKGKYVYRTIDDQILDAAGNFSIVLSKKPKKGDFFRVVLNGQQIFSKLF